MDSEIVKGKPLTKEETKFLLDLIEGSKIITTKTTNATNNKLKTEEWIRLAERFNATATNCPRTPQQLRLKWENLKKNSRKRSTQIRMNQIKTGGGPADYIPPDDILDRVTSLLGSTVSGFTVPFGGDKEMAWFDVCSGADGIVGISGDVEKIGNVTVQTKQIVDSSEITISTPLSNEKGIETVVADYQVLDVVDQNLITPNKTKRLTFGTPRAVKKKFKPDENRAARNTAIAEYYSAKKQCLDANLNYMNLENVN
ncbi:unnamed protein product [Parnassius apollo]|uniref:Regulatory protein zeste n=1 Tax=Parnassius apollo TaxID=110799 RepID=A0A8S3W513_PARAO|nr:unnamed protein product [Parnassius apollo]